MYIDDITVKKILKLLQIDALTSILIHFYEAFILQLLLYLAFYSYHDHFYAKCTIINLNCEHNAYLET